VNILNLLLPAKCVVCASVGEQLCDGCRESLPLLRPPLCERCGAPAAWPVVRCRECSGRRLAFASARAAVEYDESVRRFVVAWKERGLRRLAVEAAALVVRAVPPPRVALLVFVPPDRERVLLRGHHPAERLARELGRRWDLPVRPLLAWMRAIPHQRGLTLRERRRNVAGAFRPAAEAPTRVALVDDVYTSGATAAAAASALRKAGARRVEVVTFARVVR
jgi:predicted amidophosphoribosyltransferase